MSLNWKPDYRHACVKNLPKTTLKAIEDRTYKIYTKLKKFLAINNYKNNPAEGWGKDKKYRHRHLFTPNGCHYAVRWKPKLDKGWKRLTYQEFCAWYRIE